MTKKIECYKCLKLLADNLVLPKGLCVYCAADEADQLPVTKPKESAAVCHLANNGAHIIWPLTLSLNVAGSQKTETSNTFARTRY